MFKTFGEYMYTLLFSPLRRGRQSLNQFYIFFKVMGAGPLTSARRRWLQVREEASVLTCSDAMLPVHGADRDMLRLQGETVDNYRRRLAMKGATSEMAGLNSGIRYLAQAFGYDEVNIEPGEKPDPLGGGYCLVYRWEYRAG